MNEIADNSQFADDSSMKPADPVFGFEEFWPKVYAQYRRQFEAIAGLKHLGDEMLKAADARATEPVEKVVCALTRATITAAQEVIVLCGNGCGAGAMKVVRGMYESRWTAEYLRRHPEEVEDYLEFSKVLSWRKLQWLHENAPSQASRVAAELAKQVEDDYDQAKARFTDSKGRVRTRWSKKSIREIAEEIGRVKEYELPYAIACSIHHADFDALSALFTSKDGMVVPEPPPSLMWVHKALVSAHVNVWFALTTLNEACAFNFEDKLKSAQEGLSEAWKQQRARSALNS